MRCGDSNRRSILEDGQAEALMQEARERFDVFGLEASADTHLPGRGIDHEFFFVITIEFGSRRFKRHIFKR